MTPSQPNRRQFLQGEAARRALEQALYASQPESTGRDPSLASNRSSQALLEFHCRAMACNFSVFVNRAAGGPAATAAIDALESLEPLEEQMSVYRESSEISRINKEAHREPLKIESNLFDLLQQARELSRKTSGAFDITAGPLTKTWGFFRREGKVPDQEALNATQELVGYERFQLNEESKSIQLEAEGVELNLGAIGKGYALDRMRGSLISRGVESFLLHGGQSSVLACGNRLDDLKQNGQPQSGWPVGLRHPLRPQIRLGEIILQDQALGTSGSGNQFFRHQGKRLGHILDPRSGWPVEGVLSTTVITDTAARADALATAFFVMGYEEASRYCEQDQTVSAIFVLPGTKGEPEVKLIGDLQFSANA